MVLVRGVLRLLLVRLLMALLLLPMAVAVLLLLVLLLLLNVTTGSGRKEPVMPAAARGLSCCYRGPWRRRRWL